LGETMARSTSFGRDPGLQFRMILTLFLLGLVYAVLIGVLFAAGAGHIGKYNSCSFRSPGSGTFFGLAMLLVYPLTAQKIVGTDLFHASALLWVAGASNLLHGNVDLHAMSWLLVGSIPGVLLGSPMSIKVPDRALRIAFGLVLLFSGIKLVEVPQASLIVLVGLAAGALALAVYSVRLVQGRRAVPDAP